MFARLEKGGRFGKPGRNGVAGLVRMAELQLLSDMTAKAFGCPSIKIQRKDYGKALEEYALFTRSCMAVPGADEEKVFLAAYSLGRKVRRITGLTKPRDLERLVFYLYRNIGIEMDGDLPGEVGLFTLKKGGFQVANKTEFKGCTGEMLQWWFGWHAVDPLRYAIWDPYDHYGLEISEKDKAYILDPNTSIPDKSRGVTHTVLESLAAGTKPDKIVIHFDDPAVLGFDKEKIFTDSCSFFVCAHAELGPMNVIMMHMARDTETGCELRSRFWMGYTKEGKVKLPFFLKPIVKKKMVALLGHNFAEYANLAAILPEVYAQEKDNW